ncbi:DUF1573 domain-containing protein [Roseimaritima sediminicola]|uniref:DUF1573 domain-containing protein n=1 Tax=Roseimaritima sediminicola TaxID=2662066 RepID=UPI0013868C3C|nr:DUF1573 domain-containing protein [Roseimaritima sediminicola]
MKTHLLVPAIVICSVVAWLYTARPVPKIYATAGALEFDGVHPARKKEKSVVIGNSGDRNLLIHRIQTGCGCVETELTHKVIPPGGSGKLRVSMKLGETEVRQGKTTPVYIFSNDPVSPCLVITAFAPPSRPRKVEAQDVDLGVVAREQLPIHRRIKLASSTLVDSPKLDHAAIGINVQGTTGTMEDPVMTVRSNAASGEIFTTISTSEKLGETEQLTLRGVIQGTVSASPSMVSIGPVYPEDSNFETRIRVEPASLDAIKLMYSSSRLDQLLTVEIKKENENNYIVFRVSPKRGFVWENNRWLGVFVFRIATQSGKVERLSIPVVVISQTRRIAPKDL